MPSWISWLEGKTGPWSTIDETKATIPSRLTYLITTDPVTWIPSSQHSCRCHGVTIRYHNHSGKIAADRCAILERWREVQMWEINPHGKYIAADRSLQVVSQISDAISRFTKLLFHTRNNDFIIDGQLTCGYARISFLVLLRVRVDVHRLELFKK